VSERHSRSSAMALSRYTSSNSLPFSTLRKQQQQQQQQRMVTHMHVRVACLCLHSCWGADALHMHTPPTQHLRS
jgi:hypothetical protein